MNLISPIIFAITPIDGWCYKVINSSVLQEICSSVSKFLSCDEENILELRKDTKGRI